MTNSQSTKILKVMSFNLWHGGQASLLPLNATAEVIKKSGADFVGLQEVASMPTDDGSYHLREIQTPKIAKLLGEEEWNFFDQGILTSWLPLTRRHPQSFLFRGKQISTTSRKWGIKIERKEGDRYWMFNAHFSYLPYQPYQLLKIPYEETPFYDTEQEAIESALASREKQVEELLEDIEEARKQDPNIPFFVTGDFNEPSYLDWTTRASQKGIHPIKVEWPTTKILTTKGKFVDTYREKHPDEISNPGFTWGVIKIEKDHPDRLDFVFVSEKFRKNLISVQIIGENQSTSDIVINPWPSDHRAVLETFQF